MKAIRIFLITAVAAATVSTAGADDGKPVTFQQLPANSQEFINKHFAADDISYATMDNYLFGREYDVFFVDGTKVEFDKKGEWDNVESRSALPAGIIPAQIEEYVRKNHSGQSITKIDRDKKGYEIELGNGIEIKFNKNFMVIGYDD